MTIKNSLNHQTQLLHEFNIASVFPHKCQLSWCNGYAVLCSTSAFLCCQPDFILNLLPLLESNVCPPALNQSVSLPISVVLICCFREYIFGSTGPSTSDLSDPSGPSSLSPLNETVSEERLHSFAYILVLSQHRGIFEVLISVLF